MADEIESDAGSWALLFLGNPRAEHIPLEHSTQVPLALSSQKLAFHFFANLVLALLGDIQF